MIRHVAGATVLPEGPYDADIIILTLGRVEDTIAAISSALAQTGVSRHVTVLDQGSRNADLARLAAAIDGRQDATLLRADGNLGVAEGRNQATAFGHGRAIVALDNDAVFAAPDTVARLAAGLDAAPDLAAIGCRIVRFDDGADDLTSWGYPSSLLPLSAGSFEAATFVGAGHAIRRSAWNAVGGYDKALFFCWEEFDFCLRAIALGWRVMYRGDLAVRHKVAAEARVAWSEARWFHFVRNRLYVGRKSGDTWLALAPRIAGYALKGALNGLPRQTLRGIAAAVRMAEAVRPKPLPDRAQAYLTRCDRVWRGSWLRRLRAEVLVKLTRPHSAPAGRRHPA